MKTRAFVLRIVICLLLSLIPLTDLENFLYSTRFTIRGKVKTPTTVLIVEVPSRQFQNTAQLRAIQTDLQALHARQLSIAPKTDAHSFIYDRDAVVRQSPSLSAQAGAFWIDFRGPAGSFPRCSLNQAITGAPGCVASGRDLLLVDDLEDSIEVRTPVGNMSRAEALANVWSTQIRHRPIHRVPFALSVAMIFAMMIVVALYVIYYPVVIHALAAAGTGLLIVFGVLQLIFEYLNVYIPSANLSLSMLITYLVFSGYRLAYQENLQWRSQQHAQSLRELDEMKTNFLSLVSHDLKTPIAKIQAVSERLRREMQLPDAERPTYKEWKDLLDSIENSNNELKHYITSLLNLSKIESRKVILNKKSNDINVLIRQTLKRLRPLSQQKDITIDEKLEPLFSVECDEDLMKQVISNLVDNAIKYSPGQSRILVQSQEESSVVRVSVQDFGPGIPKEQLPLMFRKFSRLQGTADAVKGSGLGLYLSKYFIELHGGSIRVESIEGQGTTFSFTLPIETVPTPAKV